ncbi:retrovirus-related pol polyprotein from transposon TNT 1-94 [Tanacetum coccineum]
MSINHEEYILVIVDEYSRYTWVHFLRKKSQAPEIIMSFIRMVENQNDVKVKQIRTDNETGFRNHELESFCDEKGISQNFSSPYTPKQNDVAERKNITLIEAARIMLNGSILSKHFWTEAVRIACYTQNRSIIDTLMSAKVFNTRRQQIEETYHVTFDESMKAIRFTHTSEDEIGIDDSSRYPSNGFVHEDDPSRQYQINSDISVICLFLLGLHFSELTQRENHNDQMITQPTDVPSGNNTEVSGSITESLVPDVTQSHILNQASTSSHPVPQDRWSRNQHIELVNIIGDPGEGMLTRSMALTQALLSIDEGFDMMKPLHSGKDGSNQDYS